MTRLREDYTSLQIQNNEVSCLHVKKAFGFVKQYRVLSIPLRCTESANPEAPPGGTYLKHYSSDHTRLPALVESWANVCDVGSAFSQHWSMIVSCSGDDTGTLSR